MNLQPRLDDSRPMQYSDGVLRKGKRLFSLPYLSISLFVESKNNLYSSSFAFLQRCLFYFKEYQNFLVQIVYGHCCQAILDHEFESLKLFLLLGEILILMKGVQST